MLFVFLQKAVLPHPKMRIVVRKIGNIKKAEKKKIKAKMYCHKMLLTNFKKNHDHSLRSCLHV